MSRLNAELSDEAHEAWRACASSHGVSVTALLEALGPKLKSASASSKAWAETIARAQEIDVERRSRSSGG